MGGLLHEGAHGNADLVAHFFRRAFNLLRERGSFGLIATNTIAQGDTRGSGLRWICTNGGEIYSATRRFTWPGEAAVVVSVVHISKGYWNQARFLDGRVVTTISAFLFHAGDHVDPVTLLANANKSFQGSIVLGMGFTFDDSDKKGVANPIEEMHRVLGAHPSNKERIFPFIGYEEVSSDPCQSHHRYVIDFGDMPLQRAVMPGMTWEGATDEERRAWLRIGCVPQDYEGPVANDWPDVLEIVARKVKPIRTRKGPSGEFALRYPLPQRWWQYGEKRPGLLRAIAGREAVLVTSSQAAVHYIIAVLPCPMVYSSNLNVFALDVEFGFAIMQSRIHEVWARLLGSSMKDDLSYTPTTCFEPFPFPSVASSAALEYAGSALRSARLNFAREKQIGLTEVYNRFNDPENNTPSILHLRELHAEMDRAVLDAYGWTDLKPTCDFILDYVEDDDESTRRKKPWRYRWPDDIRDEVLARLLKLNQERAREEELAGLRQKGQRRAPDDDEFGADGLGFEAT